MSDRLTPANFQVMPPLTDEERAALKEDILKYGVQVPVEEDEHGNVLDGFHRAEIVDELRREGHHVPDYPRIIRLGLTTDQEKREHARRLNRHRRHLTREQMQKVIDDQLKDTPQLTDVQIAKKVGTSDKTVGKRRKHLESMSELPTSETRIRTNGRCYPAAIAKNGREAKKIQEVMQTVPTEGLPCRLTDSKGIKHHESKWWQHAHAQLEFDPDYSLKDIALRIGDCEEALASVADGSVDLVFCDPLYTKKAVYNQELYKKCGRLCQRLLKPDGLALVYMSGMFLDQTVVDMREHLDYLWTLALMHRGPRADVKAVGVRNYWKPIMVWRQHGSKRKLNWIGDVVDKGEIDNGEAPHKWHHPYEQGVAEASHLIERLTQPGELVVDPFLGSGSTALACFHLGRRFVGVDLKEGCVATCQERLMHADATRAMEAKQEQEKKPPEEARQNTVRDFEK
jgi:hypothetical protein